MTTPINSASEAAQTLRTDDQAVQHALSLLDDHTAFMKNMGSTVDQIRSDIASSYQAQSSTTFQGKINDWISAYQGVSAAVQQLRTNLETAHGTIGRAEEELHQNAAAWQSTSGDDAVFQALRG
ncbi:hypothetical protein [Actinacidiphila guanduensis]|uniref:Uncharacterized protein n=1 Tax=Actinacidiphila guanduensis TaxID=310781 RepID=A0A1H0SD84_9ACTN|nr:hypothetical protein [Actinacidiphila guanduensis]SDP39657.1 hypothetical protein SAMN05216259_12726 [Actinacidiphila guanduensis]